MFPDDTGPLRGVDLTSRFDLNEVHLMSIDNAVLATLVQTTARAAETAHARDQRGEQEQNQQEHEQIGGGADQKLGELATVGIAVLVVATVALGVRIDERLRASVDELVHDVLVGERLAVHLSLGIWN